MYNLPYFKEKDFQKVLEFLHQHPFAFVTGCDENNFPVATQLPLLVDFKDGKLSLRGHLMRNTDHHKAFEKNQSVLCVFTGPHAYVSATWYSDPHQASTWNYISVYVKGRLHFLGDDDLVEVLRQTTLHFENQDAASSTVYDNLPEDYRAKLIPAIVAFEIEVLEVDNVFKLSQNRDRKSYQHIMEKLSSTNDGKLISEEMRKRETDLFNKE